MEKVILKITNPKSGLSKDVDATDYNMKQVENTYNVYLNAGFEIKISRIREDL